MTTRKRKLRRIRIKSFWRVALSVIVLVAVVIAALLIRNAFFKKSKQTSVVPTSTSITSPTPQVTIKPNEEATSQPIPAKGAQLPYDDAIKEIAESIAKNKGITVNIINHTRVSGYSEKLRALLEINGFSVSAGNEKALKRVNSAIIEKKEGIPGEAIGKLVNIGRVREEFDTNSRFDVIIIIGDDYS